MLIKYEKKITQALNNQSEITANQFMRYINLLINFSFGVKGNFPNS